MIKVILILASFLAFSAAAVIYADEDTTTATPCLYEDEFWGGIDGTVFYFCLEGTVVEEPCPEETFFVKNATVTGCVPTTNVNPNCVNLDPVETCTGTSLTQPQIASNPTEFYICPSEGADPIMLKCEKGKAFINQNGYLGCFVWPKWRTIRNCPE